MSRPNSEKQGAQGHPPELSSLLPYVAPIFAYVFLGGVEGYLPEASPIWYPVWYTVKLVIVTSLACWYRSTWTDLRRMPSVLGFLLAALAGLFVFGIWIGLDGLYPAIPFVTSQRLGFDPTPLSVASRQVFIFVRMIGLVVIVPLIEELFWRSFLLRWLIDQDFQREPIGRVTVTSAVVSSMLFAVAHPEWLPALLTGLAWAWLLHQTKSLTACLVSHSIANLALGMYVIYSHSWKYW